MKLASAAPTSRPAALPRVQLCPSLQSAALPSRAARLVVQAATGASKSPQASAAGRSALAGRSMRHSNLYVALFVRKRAGIVVPCRAA